MQQDYGTYEEVGVKKHARTQIVVWHKTPRVPAYTGYTNACVRKIEEEHLGELLRDYNLACTPTPYSINQQ